MSARKKTHTEALTLIEDGVGDDAAVASGWRVGGTCEAVRRACKMQVASAIHISQHPEPDATYIELHKCLSALPTASQP